MSVKKTRRATAVRCVKNPLQLRRDSQCRRKIDFIKSKPRPKRKKVNDEREDEEESEEEVFFFVWPES